MYEKCAILNREDIEPQFVNSNGKLKLQLSIILTSEIFQNYKFLILINIYLWHGSCMYLLIGSIENLEQMSYSWKEKIMKIRKSITAVCTAVLFGAASQAMATVVTLDASLPASYLNRGDYQGSFDGSTVLPAQFTINSIGFSFVFADDAHDAFVPLIGRSITTESGPVVVSLPNGDKSSTITKTETTPVTQTGEWEAVQLSFGSLIFSGATPSGTPVFTSNPVLGTPVLDNTTYMQGSKPCTPSSSNSSCKATYHYIVTNKVTNTTTTDNTGNITLTQSLLSQSGLLAELMQNKALNFSLGVTGDLNLISASLNLDYTDTTPSQVPEPASLALFGIALLGFTTARVRRS